MARKRDPLADVKGGIDAIVRSVRDPKAIWEFMRQAREHGDDPKFWKRLRDEMLEQGATKRYAEDWIKGLRALATNRWPEVKKPRRRIR